MKKSAPKQSHPEPSPLPLPETEPPQLVEPDFEEIEAGFTYGLHRYGSRVRISLIAYADPSELPEKDRQKLERMREEEKKLNDLEWLLRDAEEAARRFFDKRREKSRAESKGGDTPEERAKERMAKVLRPEPPRCCPKCKSYRWQEPKQPRRQEPAPLPLPTAEEPLPLLATTSSPREG